MVEELYIECRDFKNGLEEYCPGIVEHCAQGWHCIHTDQTCYDSMRQRDEMGNPQHNVNPDQEPNTCCVCGESIPMEDFINVMNMQTPASPRNSKTATTMAGDSGHGVGS